MNQETAQDLFETGAIFLFLDVPENTEFGIDYNCWRTGPNFRGVKMIPPGLHFIYFSVSDKYGNIGLRNGFFYNFKLKEIVAKKWNRQSEQIDDYEFDEQEMENFRLNKQDLDRFLGPYPYEEYKRWISLTNNLNEKFVLKLIPDSKIISSGSHLIGKNFKSTSKENFKNKIKKTENLFKIPTSIEDAEKRLPEMNHAEGSFIHFTKIPNEVYPSGSNAIDITKHSIDMSYRLEILLKQQQDLLLESEPNEKNVLCELQFSFVCFLIGVVYDAFEQWKTLVHLLCNCETALKKYPNLFIEFINVLYFQLKEMPEDFFQDIITKENFLTLNLHNFFDNINELKNESNYFDLAIKLKEKSVKFKNYLEQRFKFNFEEEPDEYAPVICE